MSPGGLEHLLSLIEELKRREDSSGIHKWFKDDSPYSIVSLPKHKAIMDATSKYREVLVLGCNRGGKSVIGCYIDTILATGQYPDWWKGKRFDGPVTGWAVGKTGQSTRDTLQEILLGPIGAWGTGMIPQDCLGKITASRGIPNGVDTIEVKHVSGKWSTIGLKSYEQKPASFYGTAKHFIHLDEPCPELIYNECLIRTMTTNGILLHTITPKDGLTRLLADYLSDCVMLAGSEGLPNLDVIKALREAEESKQDDHAPKKVAGAGSRCCITLSWDDIPWLSEDSKSEILASTPPHLRNTVSKGIPSIGSGAVYPIPLEDVLVSPFPIPDHYRRMYGLDVGINTTAAVFGALDPDTDVLYVYGEYYAHDTLPELHAAAIKRTAGEWMVGAIDPASHNRNPNDGRNILHQYRQLGLRVREADNQVESGIYKVWGRLATGKLKFFTTTPNLQTEYMIYRRGDNQQIIKKNDHAMDALRYLVNNLRFAQTKPVQHFSSPGHSSRRYNT
jgi:phage terminase large subunit-like protein